MGTFLTRDLVEGVMARVASRNGYGYVEGNPVNYTDPSGECWNNASSTLRDRQRCMDAWTGYVRLVQREFDYPLPTEMHEHIACQFEAWGSMSYDNFVTQWNSDAPPPCNQPLGTSRQPFVGVLMGTTNFVSIDPLSAAIAVGFALCITIGQEIIKRIPSEWGSMTIDGVTVDPLTGLSFPSIRAGMELGSLVKPHYVPPTWGEVLPRRLTVLTWTLRANPNSTNKANQQQQRNWPNAEIDAVLRSPAEVKPGLDRQYPNDTTNVYYRSDGHYVVYNETRDEIVQMSNRNDANWQDPFGEPVRPRP